MSAGLRPDPAGGAYSAPSDLLDGSWVKGGERGDKRAGGEGRKGEEREGEKEGREGRGKEGKRRRYPSPNEKSWLLPCRCTSLKNTPVNR